MRWADSPLRYELGRLAGRWGELGGARAEARRWWWRFVRRYPCELCTDCGRPVGRCTDSWWRAPDELWLEVTGSDAGVLCPPCFTNRCRTRGIPLHYEAVVGV